MRTTQFQILSDLHLEVGKQYETFEISRCAPYLILAGDIGRLIDHDQYLAFLQRHCDIFQQVFLVLGNHEFYGTTREDGLAIAGLMSFSIDNLTLLQQNAIEIDGVLVVGCILGSWISDAASVEVLQKVNDFRKIKDWTIVKHNQAHLEDLAWLKKALGTTQISRVLVVTHYAPEVSQTSVPDKVDSPIVSAFATDLMTLDHPELSKASSWLFGHTHYTTDFVIRGTRMISNQRGYAFSETEPHGPRSLLTQLGQFIGLSNPKRYDVRRTIKL